MMITKFCLNRLNGKSYFVSITTNIFTVSFIIVFVVFSNMTFADSGLDSTQVAEATEEEFPWEIFYPAILRNIPKIPFNQFNIGDSIGEGEAMDGTIGEKHHDKVWSTGYDVDDTLYSLNERFENAAPDFYQENNATMDDKYNQAVSGAKMSDFVSQANSIVTEAEQMGGAGMVTILLGNNDVCSDSLAEMTDPDLFETQFEAGLDALAGSNYTKNAVIHVSGIPAIYWLWAAKKDALNCRIIWWLGNVCQSLLQNPVDDCASDESRDDPDNTYAGDGPNCLRRKEFHRLIREVYNPIIKNKTEEYRDSGFLPNAYYIDLYDVKFNSSHANDGDCFHPSIEGHKLLADEEWCKSNWNVKDPLCNP